MLYTNGDSLETFNKSRTTKSWQWENKPEVFQPGTKSEGNERVGNQQKKKYLKHLLGASHGSTENESEPYRFLASENLSCPSLSSSVIVVL